MEERPDITDADLASMRQALMTFDGERIASSVRDLLQIVEGAHFALETGQLNPTMGLVVALTQVEADASQTLDLLNALSNEQLEGFTHAERLQLLVIATHSQVGFQVEQLRRQLAA